MRIRSESTGIRTVNPTSNLKQQKKLKSKQKIFYFLGEKHEVAVQMGPGRYNPRGIERNTNTGISLKAKSGRLGLYKFLDTPAPGSYKINRNMLKREPFVKNGPMSCFAKKGESSKTNSRASTRPSTVK